MCIPSLSQQALLPYARQPLTSQRTLLSTLPSTMPDLHLTHTDHTGTLLLFKTSDCWAGQILTSVQASQMSRLYICHTLGWVMSCYFPDRLKPGQKKKCACKHLFIIFNIDNYRCLWETKLKKMKYKYHLFYLPVWPKYLNRACFWLSTRSV